MILSFARRRIAAVSAVLLMTIGQPVAAEIATPTDEVILTVNGAVSTTNSADGAEFDMAMLQALPASGFDTTTTWTEGMTRFDGVPLKVLLDAVGAKGATVTATALNNYSVEIPFDVIEDQVPIIAYHINGEPFSRRDKGPLWIVFPYDAGPDYQTELVYGWSIWQLSGLTVNE
ncbi:molybdopterin-dependent oxidoreductase [Paragemmobacter ruber]|uniref:Molybdopterin-dependent oxidoreductase n=1 Tax=Paragemmobacter ruber TaxID=1985673 RepID=A0ABW9Y942_9RHOB|nr:molybdopterin-dependent oxidoreductase [Rhodobacter ruber]NBE09106.1 molybdopterin-dependent oxidoreductase [Rhodobacter ruber]